MIEIEIFRAGDYPQGKFTASDIEEIASSYDPAIHEAPLVVGHKTNEERARTGEPSHGWIKKLHARGMSVWGEIDPKTVSPQLKADYAAGRLRKWSAEIYNSLKDAGGKKYLKAVAFLGAAAPQVKGLTPIQFKDESDSTVIYQEADMGEPVTKEDLKAHGESIFEKVKSLLSGRGKRDFADDDNDNAPTIKDALDNMSRQEIAETLEAIGDHPVAAEVAAELEAQEAEAAMAERENDPNWKFRVTQTQKEIKTFCDEMVKQGKITAKTVDAGLAKFMEALAFMDIEDSADGTVKFSEKGAATTPLAFFMDLVKDGITVPKGEAAPDGDDSKDRTQGRGVVGMNFNERDETGRRATYDKDNIALLSEAHKYAKDNKTTLADAMIAVASTRKAQ